CESILGQKRLPRKLMPAALEPSDRDGLSSGDYSRETQAVRSPRRQGRRLSTALPESCMRIDFVSDVACPWCAIGLCALERALERVGAGIGDVEIHMQPFELNPSMPPEGADA